MSEVNEPILENVNAAVKVPDDLVSFDDCPNKCTKGMIFNPYTHRKSVCPYCAEKRKTLLRQSVSNKSVESSLLDKLNLKPTLFGTSFDFSNVVPDSDRKNISDTSYMQTRDAAEGIMNKASLGELNDYSLFFSFGDKANIMNFIYPLLLRYYLAGSTIAPFLPIKDVSRLRYYASLCDDTRIKDTSYDDLVSKEVCVLWLDAGCSLKDIDITKGLMEERALNGYATIIVASSLDISMLKLQISDLQTNCLYLATPFYVKYVQNQNVGDAMQKDNNYTDNNTSGTVKHKLGTTNKANTDKGPMSNNDFDTMLGF
jgi:hypothetical protein